MSFQEQISADIKNVFINPAEFADVITWNGLKIPLIQDDDRLMEKQKAGQIEGNMLVFAAVSDFETAPNVGDGIKFNGRKGNIVDVKTVNGMYEITLNENRR